MAAGAAGRSQRKAARVKKAAAVRSLPDPETMTRAIDAIASHQPASRTYQVMTAVAYYAGLRPAEGVMLRATALRLPAKGWGRIDVTEADVAFDEPGEPKTGPRSVPIPRVLVELLRDWLDERGLHGDDLLLRTRSGARPTSSKWSRALQRGLRAIEHSSMRIYDCRHAARRRPGCAPGSLSARSPSGWATASRRWCRPTSPPSTATSPSPTNASTPRWG